MHHVLCRSLRCTRCKDDRAHAFDATPKKVTNLVRFVAVAVAVVADAAEDLSWLPKLATAETLKAVQRQWRNDCLRVDAEGGRLNYFDCSRRLRCRAK